MMPFLIYKYHADDIVAVDEFHDMVKNDQKEWADEYRKTTMLVRETQRLDGGEKKEVIS